MTSLATITRPAPNAVDRRPADGRNSTTSSACSGAATGRCARSTASRCRWRAERSPRSWGPSGSGKSTLLQLAAGLDRPTQGRVRLGEQELGGLGERALARLRRERIGFVFQSFNLLGALTAEQNVALPSRLAGTAAAALGRPRGRSRRVGLEERRGHRPAQLSGGQQQRVAIARALVGAAERRLRRRAHRRARHARGAGRAGAAARDDRRERRHAGDGHPRPVRRRVGGPRRVHGGRAARRRAAAPTAEQVAERLTGLGA